MAEQVSVLTDKFTRLESKVDAMDKTLQQIAFRTSLLEIKSMEHDKRFDAIDKRLDEHDKRFDDQNAKMDGIAADVKALRRQFTRQDKKIQKLEKKGRVEPAISKVFPPCLLAFTSP